MSQREVFISQEAAMKASEANEVIIPSMPVDVATQEAEDQYVFYTVDQFDGYEIGKNTTKRA